MNDLSFDNEQVSTLLIQIARRSLEEFVRNMVQYQPDLSELPSVLREPRASFVTLTSYGRLRGCVGNTQARWALAYDVARSAVSAASRDPRFSPVTIDELPDIRLEVTILTSPHPLHYTSFADLCAKLHPGVDGVMLAWQKHRGLLLPQVWQRIPQPPDFLKAIARKGGIPSQTLMQHPPVVQVHTFQAYHVHEPGYIEPGK